MSKQLLKLILWAVLLVIATFLTVVILQQLAGVIAYFQQGADPASALNIVPNAPPDLHIRVEWLEPAANSGRVLDDFNRQQVEFAYLWSWMQRNISLLRGEAFGLETYFAGQALANLKADFEQAAERGLVQQINTAHRLQVMTYSADGNVLALRDSGAEFSQVIRDRQGMVLFSGTIEATYQIILLQENGRWRIRQMVQTGARLKESGQPIAPANPLDSMVRTAGEALLLNGEPFQVSGINYYPQASPWDGFWSKYDPEVTAADFERIRALGFNTIRIFVGFEDFGGPEVDLDRVAALLDLLDQASAYDLRVIVTLFDFRTDYDPLLWPQADRHLEGLVPYFTDHPAILAWDIKNEPDLDYRANRPEVVNAWLAQMAQRLRRLDPHHLITIGWSSPEAAATLPAVVDVVSFHYYRPAEQLPELYAALTAATPDQPRLLTEYGLPTWNSFFPNGHTEAEQALYTADILKVVNQSSMAGQMVWTLYDFSNIPATVAGRLPWQSGPQANLGILRRDGTPKPAAALFAPGADLDLPPLPAWARFTKPFWLLVLAGAALALAGIGWMAWRWFQRRRAKSHAQTPKPRREKQPSRPPRRPKSRR